MAAVPRTEVSFVRTAFSAAHPDLRAGWSGRWGGVSEPPYESLNLALHVGDDPRAVIENRRRLASTLGVEPASFVVAEQVHRGAVHVATEDDRGRGALALEDAVQGADALVTRDRGVVLAVLVADCVPVVLFDSVTPAVGVAHAGWAGTLEHVAATTVEAMARQFGSRPAAMLAAIGPSIGPASYEVGPDVAVRARAEFRSRAVIGPGSDGKWLFDLWEANVADLEHAGVRRENVELAGVDTFTSTDRFFSHRRRRPTGRFMLVAGLRG